MSRPTSLTTEPPGQVSLTAAHCAKTLIVAAASGNQLLRQCPRLLMPGLIEFVAQSAGMVERGTLPAVRLAALNEVWKAFSLFFASVPEDLREFPGLRLSLAKCSMLFLQVSGYCVYFCRLRRWYWIRAARRCPPYTRRA